MPEMDDVLVNGIVATRYESHGAARLPSPTTATFVVGYHGPIAANHSMGPPAFVVNK